MIPGSPASHSIITDECRIGRGDAGAFEEAMERMRREYDAICAGWGTDRGLRLHVALTIERPVAERETQSEEPRG